MCETYVFNKHSENISASSRNQNKLFLQKIVVDSFNIPNSNENKIILCFFH